MKGSKCGRTHIASNNPAVNRTLLRYLLPLIVPPGRFGLHLTDDGREHRLQRPSTWPPVWPQLRRSLLATLRSRRVDEATAEDICQDVVERALRSTEVFATPDNLKRWATVVALNEATDLGRMRRRHVASETVPESASPFDVEAAVVHRLALSETVSAMAWLRPEERAALAHALSPESGPPDVGNAIVTGAQYKTGARVGHGLVIVSWTADAMATAAAQSEVFSQGCREDTDFVLNPPSGSPPPRIYRNYGCYDRRHGQQDSTWTYVGDHSFSTGRTYDNWWLKNVRVLHDYVNGQMVSFDPDVTEHTDCSPHTVSFPGPWGLSQSFTREICPTKIDPIPAPTDYTTAWSGSSSGDTEAVHQAGVIKKATNVATGFKWHQAVTVRGCPNTIICVLDNLIFGP